MSNNSKKDEILQTSIQIFVNEGFDRPTMDSIADRAQVSKRTLYKHFANKRALLNEILIYLINQNQNALVYIYDPKQDIALQLDQIVKQKVNFLLSPNNIKLSKIILAEFLKEESLLKDHIDDILKMEKSTIDWITEAQAGNKLKSSFTPIEVLENLNELINGVIFFPILFGKKQVACEIDIKNICTMFFSIHR